MNSMKINEIIARQNRIVYILLVATAVLGLAWTIWRHQYLAEAASAAPVEAAPAPRQR